MVETVSSPSVMEVLRDSTKDLHNDAEGQDFQRDLGSGSVSKEPYILYLQQLYFMHKRLGDLLREAKDPAVNKVIRDYHFDLSCLTSDLAHFGVTAGYLELPATKKLTAYLEKLAAEKPLALLGPLYVLEGSTNGAKFLAKNVRTALSLGDTGASYFDRYGEKQRERWQAFKDDMNSCGFSAGEVEDLVESARTMFKSFFAVGLELKS